MITHLIIIDKKKNTKKKIIIINKKLYNMFDIQSLMTPKKNLLLPPYPLLLLCIRNHISALPIVRFLNDIHCKCFGVSL